MPWKFVELVSSHYLDRITGLLGMESIDPVTKLLDDGARLGTF